MFYCNACAEKNGWPKGIGFSKGRCECCGQDAFCYDVPSERIGHSQNKKQRELFKNRLANLTDAELNAIVKSHFEEWKKGNPDYPEANAGIYWSGLNDGMYHLRKVLRDRRGSNDDAVSNDGEIID